MTTTPELSREQRDAAMVERYSEGETLDAARATAEFEMFI